MTPHRLYILALGAAGFAVSACQAFKSEPWDGKLYVGDSAKAAIVRNQDDESIPTKDKRFDGMICMSAGDFKDLVTKYHETRSNCPAPEAPAK